MRKTKHVLSCLTLLAFALLFYGSAVQKPLAKATEPLKTPNYDYSPAEAQERANLAIALIQPTFAKSMQYWDCKLFRDFSEHMGSDFEEVITKRGFSLRGPFQLPDDMVFNDKQSCYLTLQPEIELRMDFSNVVSHQQTQSHYQFGGTTTYTTTYWFDGSVTISGHINMIFAESFTKEKIQTPSISVPQKTIAIKSTIAYGDNNVFAAIQRHEDPGIINPLIAALEDCYQSCFTTAYNHLDPHEIDRYVTDAKAARDNRK